MIGGRIKNLFYAVHKEGHQPWVIEEVSEAKQFNNLFHISVFSLTTADLIKTFLGPENSQKKSLLFHLLLHVSSAPPPSDQRSKKNLLSKYLKRKNHLFVNFLFLASAAWLKEIIERLSSSDFAILPHLGLNWFFCTGITKKRKWKCI